MSLTLQHYQTGHPKIELCSRSTQVNLNLYFRSSCAEARHSRSVVNPSGTKDHWPLTDFSVNFCMSESGCEGEVEEGGEGDEGAGMDEAAGISDSEGVGIETWTTTSGHDRIWSCACGVRMGVSRNVTFDSRAKIVLCIAECCACNELYNNSRCWCESIVRRSKSWLKTKLGTLGC